jgi:hypothetical protein
MERLLLHPKTRLQVEYVLHNPPQVLLITSSHGGGKKLLTKNIAARILKFDNLERLNSYPYFLYVKRLKNKSDISIEQVRLIIDALKLKTTGDKAIRRVVLIEDAHFLSIPAQNALLKVLEEPSNDTVFILSSVSPLELLPTIVSRTQKIEIQPVSLNDALDFWHNSDYSKEMIASAWRLSGGYAGLLNALLAEDKTHPLKLAVDDAKKFLRSTKYQRLIQIGEVSRSKEEFLLFIEALLRTLTYLHHTAVKSGRESQAKNLLACRRVLNELSQALGANVNTRLIELKLVLGLKI